MVSSCEVEGRGRSGSVVLSVVEHASEADDQRRVVGLQRGGDHAAEVSEEVEEACRS